MLKNTVKTALAVVAFSSASLIGATASAGQGDTLKAVKERGYLNCTGTSDSFQGFFEVDGSGKMIGMDIDYCGALATAIFGSSDKLKLVPITWAQRWPALKSGEVDIVIKGSGWTMSRDTENALQFSRPYFLGGAQAAVRKDLGVASAMDLDGASVCVPSGTSTERQAAAWFDSNNVKVELTAYESIDETFNSFLSGRCDAIVEYNTQVAAKLATSDNPDDYMILPEQIALESLAMVMRQGDDQWVDLSNWLLSAFLIAEQYGITSKNVDKFKANPTDSIVARLLGVDPGMGDRFGLSNDWAYNVIKAYGNAAELYDRNLGKDSRYKMPRGVNALYSNGGVQYPLGLD